MIRSAMVRYLLEQTRYTAVELDKLNDKTIEKWYREEKQVNKM
jgi:hypothetical protein